MSIQIVGAKVYGAAAAIHGMRNPMESWSKGDSDYYGEELDWLYNADDDFDYDYNSDNSDFIIGPKDHDLCMRLVKAGSDHAKFRRFIVVTMDISAPLYWWKEFDTYKVGTVSNSTSTMHKLSSKNLDICNFSHDHLDADSVSVLEIVIARINVLLEQYRETGRKELWDQAIQLLPSSFNQLRTVQLNYEVLANICSRRINHKLKEWRDFCGYCRDALPWPEFFWNYEEAGDTKK